MHLQGVFFSTSIHCQSTCFKHRSQQSTDQSDYVVAYQYCVKAQRRAKVSCVILTGLRRSHTHINLSGKQRLKDGNSIGIVTTKFYLRSNVNVLIVSVSNSMSFLVLLELIVGPHSLDTCKEKDVSNKCRQALL